jgi:tetratricopeptide (TPR) repeat protein
MGIGWVIFISLFLPFGVMTKQEPSTERIQQGDEAFRAGDLERALHLYEVELEREPQNRRALVMAGYIHYLGMYYDKAEERLLSVLKSFPEDGDALRILGNIALQRIRPFEARSYYLRAEAAAPGPEARQEIAQNLKMAEERIARAVKLSALYSRSLWILGIVAAAGALMIIILLFAVRGIPSTSK